MKGKFLVVLSLVLLVSLVLNTAYGVGAEKKLRVAFIYVGPVGDYGWSHAHELARQYLIKKLPWAEFLPPAEAVPESDVARFIDRFVREEKADVIFTTSFGYMDATIEAGKKYPDKIFFHCSGYMRSKNVGTYFAELYQVYYLNGVIAGALTKTNKVGYVAAHPIPEVIRHINAFALGVQEVNPKATVDVRWLFSWYDPSKARMAAESLIADGCDALAFTEDSPTVVTVGEEYTKKGKQIYTFGHYSPMQKYGPNSCVSGQLVHWEVIYKDILEKIRRGVYTNTNLENVDYWWLLKEKAVELGGEFGVPINPKFVSALKEKKVVDPVFGKISVYDLIMKRLSQMKANPEKFDPFTGPIKDQTGKVRIEAGRRATHDELWNIDWFVPNVIAKIPK
jgi:simple sugar transport system substrate-binding protein